MKVSLLSLLSPINFKNYFCKTFIFSLNSSISLLVNPIDLSDSSSSLSKEIAFINKDLIVKEEVKKEIKNIEKTIIYFNLNLADIKNKDLETLLQIVKKLSSLSNFKLKITGHTDSIGTEKHNEELSKQRALKVKNFFLSKGINPKSIEVDWKADKEPISAKDEENRRVEIELIK